MGIFTLDTNPIIYHLEKDDGVVSFFNQVKHDFSPLYISTITETELFSLPTLQEGEVNDLEDLLRLFSIIAVDSRIARIAASIRRKVKIETPDSLIAATALFTGSILVTRNIKDFKNIDGLRLLKV